jgi:hypothetical protein
VVKKYTEIECLCQLNCGGPFLLRIACQKHGLFRLQRIHTIGRMMHGNANPRVLGRDLLH